MDTTFHCIFKRPTLVAMMFRAVIANVTSSEVYLFDARIHQCGQVSCQWAEGSASLGAATGVAFITARQEATLRRLGAI